MLDLHCAKIFGHPSNVLNTVLECGQVLNTEVVWKNNLSSSKIHKKVTTCEYNFGKRKIDVYMIQYN